MPCRELVVGLLDDRQIREREERVGVGAHDGPDHAALHQIAQVILAKRPVARQQIADRVILLLQRLRRRHADQPAELVLGDDPNGRASGVQLLGTLQLVALPAIAARPEPSKPSAPTTSIVVLAFTSSAVSPPSRTTSAALPACRAS